MIYDSAETIPAKLYFKILETADYKLLADETCTEEDLLKAWDRIEDEYSEITSNKKTKKVLDISKRIEGLAAKYEAITLMVMCLRAKEDQEIIDQLKEYGYRFSDDLTADLDIIERESDAIKIKIDNELDKMPKVKENDNSENITFDETIMSYCAFTGSGFIDPNKITLSQYNAQLNIGNKKMKALERSAKK